MHSHNNIKGNLDKDQTMELPKKIRCIATSKLQDENFKASPCCFRGHLNVLEVKKGFAKILILIGSGCAQT